MSFKTEANPPWALNIATDWRHPLEDVRIDQAYARFVDWANAAGSEYDDWYLSPVEGKVFYSVTPGVFY